MITLVELASASSFGEVVIYSAHQTLERDCRVAARLRADGYSVLAQTAHCARRGLDKFVMRKFFDSERLPSPPWSREGDDVPGVAADELVIVKRRHGTQSEGTRLARHEGWRRMSDEYAERFVEGVEYSVVLYRDDHGVLVLPPVWKGPTRYDLVPPWRRLRLCPDPYIAPERDRMIRDLSKRVAIAVDAYGYLEVELVVTSADEALLFEMNPRVSGTMRIAGLAAGIPIFSVHRMPTCRGHADGVRFAAEVPFDGPPFCRPDELVFGTSRLTVGASTVEGLDRRLCKYSGRPLMTALLAESWGPCGNAGPVSARDYAASGVASGDGS